MACSGQECAASRTASCWSAATSSETADAWPSMSSSSNDSGAIIEHSVCPWQRSGSTRTFTTYLLCVSATVDAEDLAGDVAGFLGYQKGARRRDVLGLAHPAYRRCRNGLFDVAEIPAFLGAAQHRGVDEARWYRIDGDAVRPVLQCQRLGEPVDGRFGRDVVRHESSAGVRAGRGDVDDASPLGVEHVGQHGLDHVEDTVEVDVDQPLPIRELDVGEALDPVEPGGVHQHGDRAGFLVD